MNSTQLNIAIVEDSIENIETLKILLEKVSDKPYNIIGIAKTVNEAKLLLANPQIDLAFLDIQLKEGTSFEVLEELNESNSINFDIVFVTAHGNFEFATRAIQFAALDFITKPIDEEDLKKVLNKISDKTTPENNQNQLDHLIQILNNNIELPSSIGIHLIKSVIQFVDIAAIKYFTADKNTSIIHLNDDSLFSVKNFGYYKDLLAEHQEFIQISKSCMVNAKHIKKYNSREKTISLSDGENIVASHRYNKHIKDKLMDWHQKSGNQNGILSMFKKLLGN